MSGNRSPSSSILGWGDNSRPAPAPRQRQRPTPQRPATTETTNTATTVETSQAPEPPPKPGATRQQTAEEKRANDLQILNAVIATERAIKYTDMLVVDVTVLALILPWGIRTIRRFDHDEKMPRGYLLNGRGKKVWEMFHIRLWVKWHYPNRSDFEKRLQALEAQELAPEKPTEVVQA